VDSQGVPYAVCGISTDITPRKRLEAALRESDERLNLALSSAGVGTWSWNIVEDAIIWDDHIHRLFGLEPGTFGGKYEDAMRMLHPDDRDRVAREVANAVESDAPYDTEHRAVWPDGSVHVLGARGKVYRATDGGALRMTGVCWDTTERKRAEERLQERTLQLEAANEALGSFTYSVSHDLRAPLRAIDGYSRILVEDHTAVLDAEGQRVLGVIQQNARQMGRLIDDLLHFSRLGRTELEKSRVDVGALVQEVVDELRRVEPERRVTVTLGALPAALADGSMIRQVLVNLIGNAWKFTRAREDAAIEVGCDHVGGEVVYFVRDNGAGFEMEYAGKLFGVFQRLHRKEDFEGTGVGLAIVQRIVQRHGGRVWAEGAVGRGATFYFTLAAAGGTQHESAECRDPAR
jgi:PAS domain S-box-containing protein